MYLMSVRQKHKKTFAIIDELYDLSFSAKSTESFKDFQTDIIDQQHYDENDVWIVDDERKRSRSMQSLVQTQNHKWCDERRFDYADQRSPQITGSISNIKKSQINKARNVPQSTYEPRYQQLCEKEQQARKMRHQKAVEMLKKVRSPRMVAKFESENFHLRRCISAEAFDWKKRETFKAKDVPLSVYVPPYKDEIEACKRARRKTERVAELIRTSRAPPGLEKHAIQSKVQHRLRHAKYCTDQEPKRNICYSRTVPNFKKLHEKLLNKLEKAAENRPVTVVTPFYFQTDEQTHHK
ncbi:unnamed protein product, partial [Onchocerca ochengi]|uniref:TPX2 domain-containing protein n=1 Tax=Onchocerca ochengi TaxID=42157 RepID=A0A182ENJ1_ONCOC